MMILDIAKVAVDVFKAGYNTATNRPQITCDVHGVYAARWCLDHMPDGKGGSDAEGMLIETGATILLANSGRVDTTVKDVYVICRSGKKVLGKLRCEWQVTRMEYDLQPLSGVIVEPRRVWGPNRIKIQGTLWNIRELPKDLKAELVVDVVAQRPIKRSIKLYLRSQ